MVWRSRPRLRNNTVYPVLHYSSRFSYPLTAFEVWFWQIRTDLSLAGIRRHLSVFPRRGLFYFLPGTGSFVAARLSHQSNSTAKWAIADAVARRLSRTPSVLAILVTGALAMNNSPANDDIDMMIVTAPHTLWVTRFFVSLYLKLTGIRRDPHLPEHSSPRVKDKICDNLWVDSRHLQIFPPGLYQAHEILQAKCLFDRDNIYFNFLHSNPWVREYLPIAYRETLKNSPRPRFNKLNRGLFLLFLPLNLLFFLIQYLYMFPKKRRERIGLGYAFFHPQGSPGYDMI